jgi:hypothetical protein
MLERQLIYVFHIFVVAPLLIYLGMCQCSQCNKVIKRIAFAFGVTVAVYHIYKLYTSYQNETYVSQTETTSDVHALPSTFEHSYTPEKYSDEVMTKDLGYMQP